MSENSHIDKIFKDRLGDRNFSNVDAMWERMDAELDREKGKKKRPVIFFITAAIVATIGFGVMQYLSKPTSVTVTDIPSHNGNIAAADKPANRVSQTQEKVFAAEKISPVTTYNSALIVPDVSAHQIKKDIYQDAVFNSPSEETFLYRTRNNIATEGAGFNELYLEKVNTDASLLAAPLWRGNTIAVLPVAQRTLFTSSVKPVTKRELPKSNSITLEAVGGGDILRLNRKAGFYAGIRLNKHLDKGSLISIGVNYASHTVRDRYRVANKPLDRGWYDAVVNNMSSVRIPIFLQRQMADSKFSMMIGLIPTYITSAEVYNVPDSYVGDPNPYRKFTLKDFNRFNLLFGAGLRYTPVKNGPFSRLSFELNGSYSFTGVVKDGYKNWSRVNDNFKSIQFGVAFRLK